MKQRITIYADDGKVLTDGNTYGTIVHLANGVSADSYYEITQEEYERILAEKEAQSKENEQ